MTFEDDLRAKLAGDIDVATWRDLRTHAARDRVILVGPEADLLDVAVALGADDAEQVAAWIRSGVVVRPTATQLAAWESALDMPFACVIVAPFVLVAERTS